ncbi:fibronectin type III domain-containing protein [Paractinoplanes maris]|uniref:fibronectin type III domain-containing protein n=1 Tax=Paractinoplanes maris TaxID=1734446 RepID=UPI00202017C3|nr:fibronectin type III domain-containing protein [Actinoplanes maris]
MTAAAVLVSAGTVLANPLPAAAALAPPENVTALPGRKQLVVNWTAPQTPGGTVTRYRVTLDNGGGTCNVNAPTNTCTFSGLTSNLEYTASVIVCPNVGNDTDCSDPSVATATARPGPPVTPAAPTVTYGSDPTKMAVTWAAPSNSSSISAYRVTPSATGLTGTCADLVIGTSCEYDNLTPGTSYSFRVTAIGVTNGTVSSGSSTLSPSSTAKIAGVPTAPGKPTLTVDDEDKVTVSWVKPVGGPTITGFTVYSLADGVTSTGCTVGANDTSCQVTNLNPAKSYTFTVKARGEVVASPSVASDPSDPVIPGMPAVPDAPGVELTAAGAATVYWDPPASGGDVDTYTVDWFSPDLGAATPTPPCEVAGDVFSCDFTGLQDGKSYQFNVTATNTAGARTSGWSAPPVISQLPAEPSKPAVSLVEGTSGAVKLTWNPGSGGGTVTNYAVTVAPQSAGALGSKDPLCGTSLTAPECEITGLTPSVEYKFTVSAVGDLGATASADSDPIIPAAPGTPDNVVAAIGATEGSVLVTWGPPIGGGPVAGYKVTATTSDSGTLPTVNPCEVGPTVFECAFSGMQATKTYQFTVVAENLVDTTSAAATPAIVPGEPGKPTGVTVTLNSPGDVTLDWTAPLGAAVDKYIITTSSTDDLTPPAVVEIAGNLLTADFTTLDSDKTYTFVVAAKNDLGTVPADATDPIVPDVVGIPADVEAELVPNTPGRIKVTWSAPTGGGTPTSYVVSSDTGNGGNAPSNEDCTVTVAPGEALSCTMLALDLDEEYAFTVQAVNVLGPGVLSDPTDALIPDAPGEPTGVTAALVTDAPGSVKVRWSAPIDRGTADSFEVTGTSPNGGTPATLCTRTASQTECTLSEGIEKDKQYRFVVTAKNAAGSSSASPTAAIVPDVPSAPTGVGVALSDAEGKATVSWTATTTGGAIDGFTVTATSADPGALPGTDCEALANETECDVTALSPDKTYTFTVVASNDAGDKNSQPSDPLVPGKPLAPASVNAEVTSIPGNVTVTWPEAPEGVVVTKYTVEANSTDGGVSRPDCEVTPADDLECPFTNLTTTAHYTFTVTGENDLGDGAPATSESVIPNKPNAPGTPTAEITAVDTNAGTGTVKLTWKAPPAGAGPVAGYTVSAYAEGDPNNAITAFACEDVSLLTCDFGGLSLTETYTFVVTAKGIGGATADSGVSDVVDMRAPEAPGTPTVTLAGANAVRVTWTAPATGGPVVGYTVTSSPALVTPQNCTNVSGLSCIFTGLTSGDEYTFAVTSIGTADRTVSGGSSAQPILVGVPDAPERPTVVPGSSSTAVVVSWTAPSAGAGIAGYTVESVPGRHGCAVAAGSSATSCAVTGLTATEPYRFRVQANGVTGAGDSAFSPVSEMIVPQAPGRPGSVDVAAGNQQIAVSWAAPQYGADRVASYRAVATPGGAYCTSTSTECVITGLDNLTSYRVTVVAVGTGDLGTSPVSAQSARVRPTAGAPSSPREVLATGGNGGATVTWTAPAFLGDGVVGYTVTATPSSGSIGSRLCFTTELTCPISGLTNGTPYKVTVTAQGRAASGYSAPSTAVDVTPSVAPQAPTEVRAVAGALTLGVSWTAGNAGSGVSGFTATATGGTSPLTCSVGASASSCTITGVTAGTTYTVTVVANGIHGAVSTPGSSAPVVAVTAVAPAMPSTVPATVGALTSSAGSPVRLGATTTVSGTGFAPNTAITIGIYPGPHSLATAVTNANGAFSVPVTISGVAVGSARTIVAGGLYGNTGVVRWKTVSTTVQPSL